ncbi:MULTISPECIES: FliC/FljB family flagellin [unclassified Cobetia]|uniref:FliC/FljB family flagellin n=1 Tax=unclassified Cobetia TaxID=2609414 RepID=UPI00178CC388|nr:MULTISPECIES: FliC/FljB family flagellin [unclassified Cobetia]MBE2169128.1 FliC/FljB family flagellin [Cobetia sp. 2AS1]MDH2446614.1 FliC/FljB family flagellin [Cobetia sp. 2AS]
MASVINTNTLSMVTQQNLNQSQNALNTSMERLSSGLRINSAKDDAAGQAIANRMDSQITGLSQAQRNANDGISVAQTAEGALNQVNDNLQRVRELTVQAQNGTNNAEDLQSIQDEITMRMDEIDRISEQTSFNGINVLDTDDSLSIQVGAYDDDTIDIELERTNRSTLGLEGFSVSSNTLNISDKLSQVTNGGGTPADVNLSSAASTLGVDADSISLHNVKDANGNATSNFIVKSGDDHYAASVDDSTGKVELNKVKVSYADEENGITTANAVSLPDQLVKVGSADDGTVTSYVDIQGSSYEVASAALANGGGSPTSETDASVIELSGASATEQFDGTASLDPLAQIDSAIKKVDSQRSALGAVQNRFDSAITNLATTETNLASAQSRIQDADYAEEVSSMTTAQILQQAGTSMLTQANQVPQNVLSLLG